MSKRPNVSVPDGLPKEYTALCPLDGRYQAISKAMAPYFSEYALMKNRVCVELDWLLYLLDNGMIRSQDGHDLSNDVNFPKIHNAIFSFYSESNGTSMLDSTSMLRIKEIEKTTNHDVKAVELFIAEKLKELGYEDLVSFVHIGCTSEDINNTAYACMIRQALNDVWYPAAEELISKLADMARQYVSTPMLAHTHGQPATPTTVGKELAVYVRRLNESVEHLRSIPIRAKFNGATGTYAAISTAYPDVDWPSVSQEFVEEYLKLDFNPATTQIEGHDYVCRIADGIRNFNNILLDLDLDMWIYISMEYFKQATVASEVGSSTMPHKVNPIRFENSEANVGISNALLMELSNKLPRSRMQRDLSDSSTQRNIGMAIGYSLQAIQQTLSGLSRVSANVDKLSSELNDRWEVLAEPVQTMLRKYGIQDAYDQLKALTRGKGITKEALHEFINSLEVLSPQDKETLLNLTPASYIGWAKQIVFDVLDNL